MAKKEAASAATRREIERLEAESAARAEREREQYEKLQREVENANAEHVETGRALLAHEELLLRAYPLLDWVAWDWEAARRQYDRAAHEEAQRRDNDAADRLDLAVQRLVRLGNWIAYPAQRARDLRAAIGESQLGGAAKRRRIGPRERDKIVALMKNSGTQLKDVLAVLGDVAPRTVEREIASLREEGKIPPSKRRRKNRH